MSVDSDRLSVVLEDLRSLQEGAVEAMEYLNDVVTAATPVELETDPAGHAALKRAADEIDGAFKLLLATVNSMDVIVAILAIKARQ